MPGQISENIAREELAKYFQLKIVGAPMFCSYIDDVWHNFLKDRAAYDKFSRDNWGVYITHHSFQSGDPVYYEIPWVSKYEEKFGNLPDIWFAKADGTIDITLLDTYKKTGKVQRLPPLSGFLLTCDCKPGQ